MAVLLAALAAHSRPAASDSWFQLKSADNRDSCIVHTAESLGLVQGASVVQESSGDTLWYLT